ncbi:class I SAM-dependent methyltransferase [soil metagenome]|jgi:predicted TPR repeat methyltransferase
MKTEQAYDSWSEQYDTNTNLTRDLEALALRSTLTGITKSRILEVGCGTGKNSVWLAERAELLAGVDLSAEMLAKARSKVKSPAARFLKADINAAWTFVDNDQFDIITFSLVLEHIEALDFIFSQAKLKLRKNGLVYIGELHPFKQYNGSKARFSTSTGTTVVECFTHNISDFVLAAQQHGFKINDIGEWFDNDDRANVPRILTLTFIKE